MGGVAALPIWMEFMRHALKDKPEHSMEQPENIVSMRIDPVTGLLVDQDSDYGILETFREEYLPNISIDINTQELSPDSIDKEIYMDVPEQLF